MTERGLFINTKEVKRLAEVIAEARPAVTDVIVPGHPIEQTIKQVKQSDVQGGITKVAGQLAEVVVGNAIQQAHTELPLVQRRTVKELLGQNRQFKALFHEGSLGVTWTPYDKTAPQTGKEIDALVFFHKNLSDVRTKTPYTPVLVEVKLGSKENMRSYVSAAVNEQRIAQFEVILGIYNPFAYVFAHCRGRGAPNSEVRRNFQDMGGVITTLAYGHGWFLDAAREAIRKIRGF